MRLSEGKIHVMYEVIDVPQSEECLNCIPCLRLKMMEMSFIAGQKILLTRKQHGIVLIDFLSDHSSDPVYSIALRDEEAQRIIVKEFINE